MVGKTLKFGSIHAYLMEICVGMCTHITNHTSNTILCPLLPIKYLYLKCMQKTL